MLPLCGDLRSRARSYTKNDADADDLVQETLLKAFKAFDELRDESHPWGWLVCIMRNTWISNHRATQRRPAEVLSGEIAEGRLGARALTEAACAVSAEHHALRHVMNPGLIASLQELSVEIRKTFYYIAVCGMASREASEVMGIPEGTVLSRMHRARIKLRRSLGADSRGRATPPREHRRSREGKGARNTCQNQETSRGTDRAFVAFVCRGCTGAMTST